MLREEHSKERVTFELRLIRRQLAVGSLGGRKFQMEGILRAKALRSLTGWEKSKEASFKQSRGTGEGRGLEGRGVETGRRPRECP